MIGDKLFSLILNHYLIIQVTSKVDSCLKDLERHEELKKGQKELRVGQEKMEQNIMSGQVKIQNGLTEIRDVMKEQTAKNSPSE
ncbi:hypothetical protein FRC03_000483 [Tulasnella sp. 419]|nr:hypothetical protein FRC03_000483 [Tulasnella sp. 419]